MGSNEARFFRTFGVTTAVLVAGLILVAVVVDPYGIFGTSLVPTITSTSRVDKLSQIDSLEIAPEAVIIGSSRAMNIDPDQVASFTKCRAYNLSVNNAKPEDFLAFTRYLVEQKDIRPKLLMIGIDPDAFDDVPIQYQALNYVPFRKYLGISFFEAQLNRLGALREHLNGFYIRDTARSLWYAFVAGYPEKKMRFAPNGQLQEDRVFPKPKDTRNQKLKPKHC